MIFYILAIGEIQNNFGKLLFVLVISRKLKHWHVKCLSIAINTFFNNLKGDIIMTKKFIRLLSVCALIVYGSSANALLVLSGDGNITTNLGVVAGNDTFFTNVLQGGSSVTIHEGHQGGGTSLFAENIDNFYNSLSGVSSSIVTSGTTITDASLAGSDMFISVLPENNYLASELSAMSSFLTGGGSIFFLGENGGFDVYNSIINDSLLGLGSSMSILLGTTFDGGFHLATGSQIATDPLTAGVTEFSYAAPNEVSINGGTSLFFGTQGQAFVSYESASVPEPSIIALLSLGLVGIGFARRKA